MSKAPPPPVTNDGWFTHKTLCAMCGKHRSSGKHTKCSRLRQAAFAAHNEKVATHGN